MADQTLAQSSTLKKPVAERTKTAYALLRKVSKAWKASRCWARYLLVGAHRGVPELVDFLVGNHLFLAIQVPSEQTALGEMLANLRPERALEIGTARGGTLLFLCKLASLRATIVSVDLPGGRFGGGYGKIRAWFYQHFARRRQRLHLLQGDSHSTGMLNRVKAAFSGQPLDYLFIDGDHRYEGVKSDFEMYAPLVRSGGLIAFHDIVNGPAGNVGGVPRFWSEIKAQYRHTEIIDNASQGGFGIGVLYVDHRS